jgi:hypothetical protein
LAWTFSAEVSVGATIMPDLRYDAGGLIGMRGTTERNVFAATRTTGRYCCFALSISLLTIGLFACSSTWTQPFVRIKENEREVKLFMSHRGQVRWFQFRIMGGSWHINGASTRGESLSIFVYEQTRIGTSSSDNTSTWTTVSSDGVYNLHLMNSHLPQWAFDSSNSVQTKELQIPYWVPLTLALLFSAISGRLVFSDLRGRRRLRRGLCPRCGYDLRATPDCCPECGLIVAARA